MRRPPQHRRPGYGGSLRPCGVDARTLWILPATESLDSSYGPLIAATDTDFTTPYVLTDAGPVNGLSFEQQHETATLQANSAGQISSSQLGGADFGALAISPLTVGTTSLPAATGGAAYTASLAAFGGATPYTWAVTTGSPPPGLSLDASTGVISGTIKGTGLACPPGKSSCRVTVSFGGHPAAVAFATRPRSA